MSINYAEKFQKSCDHDYNTFFKNLSNSGELILAQKELKRIRKEMEQKQHEVITLENNRYNDDFEPIQEEYYLVYNSRNFENFYFDAVTGETAPSDIQGIAINLSTKRGTFSYIKGYNFSLGAVLLREVSYNINTNNTAVKFTSSSEVLIPIMESAECIDSNGVKFNLNAFNAPSKALKRIKADYFINTFFGLDKEYGIDLYALKRYFEHNASTEIILKTATDKRIMRELLEMVTDKCMPIHKLVGCSKDAWEFAYQEGVQYEYLIFTKYLKNTEEKMTIKKTDNDWIEFLKFTQAKEQDLDFYNIGYGSSLAETLVSCYIGENYYAFKKFNNYYKFGKFCSYVVDETINQGINSIANFSEFLGDYISMCEDINVKPTLYSSYLKQTHDICSRNHKISVTEEMNAEFCARYDGFEPYEYGDYTIIAPTACKDLQREGDALNHCVASYITRVNRGECLIVFLRLKEEINKSLITVEIRNDAIVQARGIHNRDITFFEETALRNFAMDRKLKYKL